MKKLLVFAFLSVSQLLMAQFPTIVSDPQVQALLAKTNASSIESITKASEQLKTANKQLDLIKAANEKLQKVKSAISQGKMIKKILSNFQDIGKTLLIIPKRISDLKYKSQVASYSEKYKDITDELDILTELVTQSLTTNLLEASDSQRLSFLYKIYQSTNDLKRSTRSLSSVIFAQPRNIKF